MTSMPDRGPPGQASRRQPCDLHQTKSPFSLRHRCFVPKPRVDRIRATLGGEELIPNPIGFPSDGRRRIIAEQHSNRCESARTDHNTHESLSTVAGASCSCPSPERRAPSPTPRRNRRLGVRWEVQRHAALACGTEGRTIKAVQLVLRGPSRKRAYCLKTTHQV